MSRLIRSSLALVGLALVIPTGVFAQDAGQQDAYGGYRSYQAAAPAPAGLDGKPMPAPATATSPAMGYSVPAEPKHAHKGKTMCASCAAKAKQAEAMRAQGMPPGVIVSCAHSKTGVCPACRDLLAMPGTVTMGAPSAPVSGEAPGRAMASSGSPASAPSAGAEGMASRTTPDATLAYGPQGAGYDPAPIGVVQANYAQMYGSAPMPAPAQGGSMASQPGRATASSSAGSTPYAPKNGPFPHPHILGHLFGFSGIGNERRDERAQKKSAAHASISYDNEGTTVTEIPASMLKKGR